jgi:hypothetical protein
VRLGLAGLPVAFLQLAFAPTIIIDNTTCTLVDAIAAANTDSAVGGCPAGSGADTLELTADVTLTEVDNFLDITHFFPSSTPNGLPQVNSEITLEGSGFTIERDAAATEFRLLAVLSDGTLTLNDVTLRGGSSVYGGGIINYGGYVILTNTTVTTNDGDGLYNRFSIPGQSLEYGTLTLSNSVLSNNTGGSGIESYFGDVTVANSTISGNSWGGIAFMNSDVTVTNSTVSGNGGGISFFYSSGLITSSTISGNSGSGIWIWSSWLSIQNTTISGNTAQLGGAVYSYQKEQDAVLRNCTMAGNSSGVYRDTISGTTDIESSILAFNGTGEARHGSDGNWSTLTGFDSRLADNGGPTLTHALLPGSSAIDAAGNCSLAADQRGRPRDDGACDSGAYEFGECLIAVERDEENTFVIFTAGFAPFNVVTGFLSDLLADGDFSGATCLGMFSSGPAVDSLPEPLAGDGRYYLAGCGGTSYGSSSIGDDTVFPPIADPRDELVFGPCP